MAVKPCSNHVSKFLCHIISGVCLLQSFSIRRQQQQQHYDHVFGVTCMYAHYAVVTGTTHRNQNGTTSLLSQLHY